jgi:hypothetical protein
LDFWDLTRLLYRRWYLTVPMLLLTAVGSTWTLVGVKPNYIATAYVQLVGPVIQPTEPGQQSADQRNPWLSLGLNTLANAAMVTVQDYTVIEALHAHGYSDTFTATLNSAAPLVTFEITGTSPAQATATASELVSRYQKSVADLQSTYGALTTDLVTARRLDLGTNIQESNARVKRAVVAVAGVGLLFTIALTVGVDARIRRRARRAAGLVADDLPSAGPAPNRGGGGGPAWPERMPNATAPGRPVMPEPSPMILSFTDASRSASLEGNGNGRGSAVVTVNEGRQDEGAGGPTDATIVLPLSFKASRQRDTDDEGKKPR